MSIRILIADDHGVLRAGLHALLNAEPDLEVVGEASDGHEALRLAGELRPDVVLLDLVMPGLGGIEVARQLKKSLPDTRTLILTVHEDIGLLREAIQAGAAGYLIKRAVESDLINAIHAVWRGDLYVHPAMTRALVQDLPPAPAAPASLKSLTPREIEVLRLIAQGYTNNQVAEGLSLSPRTVEIHRTNLMRKLGLCNRTILSSNQPNLSSVIPDQNVAEV
jgi:two-component system, NarL family, response regulator NreC